MKALLDTNIIIHREANRVVNQDIGYLFKWLDKLKIEKCIHHLTVVEINKYKDSDTVKTMNIKNGMENVYVKEFSRDKIAINHENPRLTFPYLSRESDIYIVPIYPEYHTELFPDSILRTESPGNFVENEPYRNALSKVYISRSLEKDLRSGDLIVFYRTGTPGNAIHTGVATTVGVVESVVTNISDEATFIALCRKRSVFSDAELKKHWNYNPYNKPVHLIKRPFIVNFLYSYSFPKRPNLKWLNDNGIISDIKDMPRGFRKITRENFNKIIKYSQQ